MTDSTQKFLINCQDGFNNLERATISFILAVTASKTAETAMFVTADATDLLIKNSVDGIAADGHEPLADLMNAFLNNGGKIWLCPVCVKTKNIVETDLIDEVEIAGAPKTMAFLASGAKLLA